MTNWKRFNGNDIGDLAETILSDITTSDTDDLEFYIGGDSQSSMNKVKFTVAIIMVRKGKGGRGYYKNVIPLQSTMTLQQRLFMETFKAVKVALWLNPLLESIGYKVNEIHTDLNPNPKHPSYEMVHTCLGYIKGMGFKGKAKPHSWAASSVADYKTK
tara:strand:+ start:1304 stop:1777 length:474 start_codon:yes stop_codon:yes gene_type:complete